MTLDLLKDKINKIIELGGDAEELSFWEAMYGNLPDDTRKDLLENLDKEIQALKDLKIGEDEEIETT